MRTWKCRSLLAGLLLAVLLLTACASSAARAIKKVELGQKYLTELNYTEAVASFTEAISLDPDNIQAYIGRAEAYMALGEYDKALEDYQFVSSKTEKLPYTRALSYIGQAEVYEKTDEPEKAISDYELAKALLSASDAGKEEEVSEEDVGVKLVQVLYAHAALCESIKSYDKTLDDYDELLKLGEKVEKKRDELLSQLGDSIDEENSLPGTEEPETGETVPESDTEEPAAESAAEKPTEETDPEQEASSESQKPEEETKKEEPASSSEQPTDTEEAASSQEEEQPKEQKKQSYTAKRVDPWANDVQSGTTTDTETVSYQIGGNTINVNRTYVDVYANYAEPGITHTWKTTEKDTYTLSQPIQGLERQGEWVAIWDVPAGTVISHSYTYAFVDDEGSSSEFGWTGFGWLETQRILTSDEVYEWGYGANYNCTYSGGETLTVEKGKLYELVDGDEGGCFTTNGGFVFRGV